MANKYDQGGKTWKEVEDEYFAGRESLRDRYDAVNKENAEAAQKYHEQQQQKAAAAAAAKQLELKAEYQEAVRIAEAHGLNFLIDMSGWTREEKKEYLLKIIKICTELNTERINFEEAQRRVDSAQKKVEEDRVGRAGLAVIFVVDNVTIGVPVAFAGAAKITIEGTAKTIINSLMFFGIAINVASAVEYFIATGDVLGAIIRLVLDVLVTLLLPIAIKWLAILGNTILPGLGLVLAVIVGVSIATWWSLLGGKDWVADKIRELIIGGTTWTVK